MKLGSCGTSRLENRVRRHLLARGLLRQQKDPGHLKWGIVGTGYMATVWADLLLGSKTGALTAVCSRDMARAKAFSHRFGSPRPYEGIDEMLAAEEGELDCIYVATPLENHFRTITRCIRGGFNVLTEKPATEKPEEWANMVALATEQNVFLAEGMWARCLPTFKQAESWIEQGRIGPIRWIKADLQKFTAPSLGINGSGVLMDYGVYCLYIACHFLGGAPQRIEYRKRHGLADTDTDWAILAEREGVTAVLNISSNYSGCNRASIIGDHGAIEWGVPFNRTNRITLHDFREGRIEDRSFSYRAEGFEHQLAEVTQSIQRGLAESPLLAHQMTLETLRFAEQLQYQSD